MLLRLAPSFILDRLPLIVADLSLACQRDSYQRRTFIIGLAFEYF